MTIATLLLLIAAILFLCASIGISGGRVSLGWLGAFFAALAMLAPALG